jgi:hypothetical protein
VRTAGSIDRDGAGILAPNIKLVNMFVLIIAIAVVRLFGHVGSTVVTSPSPLPTPAFDTGCQTWDYALDTWRIVPERVKVEKAIVEISWHLSDIFIPGTPGAENEDFEGAISIWLDDGPRLTNSMFSRVHDSERPRTLIITNAKPGRHHLVMAVWQDGFEMGQFVSCFTTPSQEQITHKQWRDVGGEGWQSP